MRVTAAFVLAGFVAALALAVGAQAAEQAKTVTLEGMLMCGKCALKEAKQCQNVIQVKEDGKDVTYYLKDKGKREDYHEEICTGKKAGKVTGTVTTDKDGKKHITPTKGGVKFAKQ